MDNIRVVRNTRGEQFLTIPGTSVSASTRFLDFLINRGIHNMELKDQHLRKLIAYRRSIQI